MVVDAAVIMVHAVSAAKVAVATVKATRALPADPDVLSVKVVDPQSFVVGGVVSDSVQSGRTSEMLSSTSRAAVHLKARAVVVAAPAIGRLMLNEVPEEKAANSVAVWVVIAVAPKLSLAAVTATVADPAVWLTVAPDAQVREQEVLADRVSVADVKTMFAPSWPELATAVVKFVVPHPVVVGTSSPVSVQLGKTSFNVPPTAMS